MIHTEREYNETLQRLETFRGAIAEQRRNMKQMNFSEEQIERALQPALCFCDQLEEEIDEYVKNPPTP